MGSDYQSEEEAEPAAAEENKEEAGEGNQEDPGVSTSPKAEAENAEEPIELTEAQQLYKK